MQTVTYTGQRRHFTVDGIVSLILSAAAISAAVFAWRHWAPTSDSMLGFFMAAFGAVAVMGLVDFWEGEELVYVHDPDDEGAVLLIEDEAAPLVEQARAAEVRR